MRMTPFHLVRYGQRNILESKETRFLCDAGMKHDLKKKIAELVLERGGIAARNRVGHLVGFLDRVGRDRRKILLTIPWTATLRVAQPRHDGEQTVE
jgi:hypothetical protein